MHLLKVVNLKGRGVMFKITKMTIIIAVLFACISSGQADWKGTDSLDVTAKGDDTLAVITDAKSNVNTDESTKDYTGYTVTAGASEVDITSSSTMTGVSDEGEEQTVGTTVSESFTNLPTSLVFGFVHQQSFDFSDTSDIITDVNTMMLTFGADTTSTDEYADYLSDPSSMDPDFPDVDVFNLVTSEDALNEMVDESLERAGSGVTLEKLKNLQYELSYDRRYSSSRNGESCYWGESKNKVIRLT
jgi:hypothetical protein